MCSVGQFPWCKYSHMANSRRQWVSNQLTTFLNAGFNGRLLQAGFGTPTEEKSHSLYSLVLEQYQGLYGSLGLPPGLRERRRGRGAVKETSRPNSLLWRLKGPALRDQLHRGAVPYSFAIQLFFVFLFLSSPKSLVQSTPG